MEKLRAFLNDLSIAEQSKFAERCDTTIGYLRKAISRRQRFGEGLCIEIERHSDGKVCCEDLRADIDWAFLRGRARPGRGARSERRSA